LVEYSDILLHRTLLFILNEWVSKKNRQRKMLLQSKLKNPLSVIRMYRNKGKMNGGWGEARFYLCYARHSVPAERERRRAQINGLTGSEDKVAQLLAHPTKTESLASYWLATGGFFNNSCGFDS
jgi:hypothetical protein